MVSSCAVPSARMRRLRSRRRGRLVPPLLSDALLSHGLDVRGDRALVVRERLRLDLDHLRRVALGRHSAGPAASQALRGHHQRPSASRSDLDHHQRPSASRSDLVIIRGHQLRDRIWITSETTSSRKPRSCETMRIVALHACSHLVSQTSAGKSRWFVGSSSSSTCNQSQSECNQHAISMQSACNRSQVVRRLVEQQHITRHKERRRERHSHAPSARQMLDRSGGRGG